MRYRRTRYIRQTVYIRTVLFKCVLLILLCTIGWVVRFLKNGNNDIYAYCFWVVQITALSSKLAYLDRFVNLENESPDGPVSWSIRHTAYLALISFDIFDVIIGCVICITNESMFHVEEKKKEFCTIIDLYNSVITTPNAWTYEKFPTLNRMIGHWMDHENGPRLHTISREKKQKNKRWNRMLFSWSD